MNLSQLSAEVVELLAMQQAKLVLAESCTAGLIAANLGGVPGVSQYLCGSAVVYRERTKIDWLDVKPAVIEHFSAVSEAASCAIATGVLAKTEEANVALGITGHLGPGSPGELDGQIFVACCQRIDGSIADSDFAQYKLNATSRVERQTEAAWTALTHLKLTLSKSH